jgi:hypothetical protein
LWLGEGDASEDPDRKPARSPFLETLHGIEVFSAPWNLKAGALVGVWLMAAPSVLGLAGAAADTTHIAGALVATFAVIAFAEPARLTRYLNVLCGLWVILAPWVLDGGSANWTWIAGVTGLALIALSLRRGAVEDRYGGWERWIR